MVSLDFVCMVELITSVSDWCIVSGCAICFLSLLHHFCINPVTLGSDYFRLIYNWRFLFQITIQTFQHSFLKIIWLQIVKLASTSGCLYFHHCSLKFRNLLIWARVWFFSKEIESFARWWIFFVKSWHTIQLLHVCPQSASEVRSTGTVLLVGEDELFDCVFLHLLHCMHMAMNIIILKSSPIEGAYHHGHIIDFESLKARKQSGVENSHWAIRSLRWCNRLIFLVGNCGATLKKSVSGVTNIEIHTIKAKDIVIDTMRSFTLFTFIIFCVLKGGTPVFGISSFAVHEFFLRRSSLCIFIMTDNQQLFLLLFFIQIVLNHHSSLFCLLPSRWVWSCWQI